MTGITASTSSDHQFYRTCSISTDDASHAVKIGRQLTSASQYLTREDSNCDTGSCRHSGWLCGKMGLSRGEHEAAARELSTLVSCPELTGMDLCRRARYLVVRSLLATACACFATWALVKLGGVAGSDTQNRFMPCMTDGMAESREM